MNEITIKKLEKGNEFQLSETDTKIYILEKYSKNLKRYICHLKGDISEIEHIKKHTKVWVKD